MKIFGIGLCVFLAEGLMIKHMAFILMHGSIFESLRWGANRRMRENRGFKRWYFQKVSELFSCNLCMTAQVSLWFHGLLFIFLWLFFRNHVVNTFGFLSTSSLLVNVSGLIIIWFCWSMLIAASSMFMWELTGIPIAMAHENERHKKAMEDIDIRRVATENDWQPSQTNNMPVTFLDFFYMITVVEWDTTGIGCRGLKGIIRGEEIEEICQQWSHDKGITWEQTKMEILPLIQEAAKYYFAGLKEIPNSRMAHMHRSWNKAQKKEVTG